MPGSFESNHGEHFPEFTSKEQRAEEGRGTSVNGIKGSQRGSGNEEEEEKEDEDEDDERTEGDSFDDGAIFDDDILAAGEMKNVPF